MYCPECGTDAGEAKFCPECGTDLSILKKALRGGQAAGKPAGAAAQQRKSPKQTGVSAAEAPDRKPGQLGPRKQTSSAGTRPWAIWVIVALVVVPLTLIVVIPVVWSHKGSGTPQTPAPVANTSGTYAELVQRADDLFSVAQQAFKKNDMTTVVQYSQAAATVYAAAWKKQPGDPGVGGNWATAMFYSGDFKGAIALIEQILKAHPTFQTGWYNAGNYYWHASQMSTNNKSLAQSYIAKARAAYEKAIALGPNNADGISAAKNLKQLPK